MSTPPDGRTLANRVVRLDRLTDADYDELYDAIADPRVYEYGFGGGSSALPGSAALMRHKARRHPGGRAAPPHATGRRHLPGHCPVLDHRRRMA